MSSEHARGDHGRAPLLVLSGIAVVFLLVSVLTALAPRSWWNGWFAPVGAVLCLVAGYAAGSERARPARVPGETDILTELPNRAGTLERGEQAVAGILADGHEVVLVLVDITRFHEINSALGYAGGDQLLQVISRGLREMTPRAALIGRAGGDEFVLVFRGGSLSPTVGTPNAGTPTVGMSAAGTSTARPPEPGLLRETTSGTGQDLALGQRVLRQVQGPFRVCGVDVAVDASVGIAVAPRDDTTMADLLICADAALARARQEGESVGVWAPGVIGVQSAQIALYAQLRTAIAHQELVLYYQPLKSAQSGVIVAAEALLRWQHPARGLLAPGDFLSMAERAPMIADLTRWVLDEAARQCAAWAASGLRLAVSVNLSPRMFVLDDLPQVVVGALNAHGLPSDALTLEITESAVLTQPDRAAAMLHQLRAQGVEVSLDDFGTGYNSMEILKALPFDEVKIDRVFVADASGSAPDAAIVRSVIELGHRLGLRVVGEGIENERTQTMMIDLGCDLLQGAAISPPVPAARMSALLRAQAGVGHPPRAHRRPAAPRRAAAAASPTATSPTATSPTADWTASPDSFASSNGSASSGGPAARNGLAVNGTAAANGVRPGALRSPRLAELTILDERHILRTAPEPAFDAIASIAAEATGCAAATIVFVEGDREWSKTHVGTASSILARESGIATRVVAERAFVEIQDLSSGGVQTGAGRRRYAAGEKIRFAAGAPIIAVNGSALGALVVVDRTPHHLTTGQRRLLGDLAGQIVALLEARARRVSCRWSARHLPILNGSGSPRISIARLA
ncbi:hypothetical protein FAIPA1_150028 [Frankia sp. AiPs1]|uniref:putative bifunctional diguanylate cyclase/phosphodiesterase n=1 Tax=Frankia sp. AiPa1 TaxID=573492 RepID=UPI00202B2605|nr:EAL domain-containing protein [Frankia sp. AiPa1]MCL9761366.1 bifunctional diguanylate cyclase/phosphodiesterase [Frankia sp. AiPa1]